jgi:hypothetical protein
VREAVGRGGLAAEPFEERPLDPVVQCGRDTDHHQHRGGDQEGVVHLVAEALEQMTSGW